MSFAKLAAQCGETVITEFILCYLALLTRNHYQNVLNHNADTNYTFTHGGRPETDRWLHMASAQASIHIESTCIASVTSCGGARHPLFLQRTDSFIIDT